MNHEPLNLTQKTPLTYKIIIPTINSIPKKGKKYQDKHEKKKNKKKENKLVKLTKSTNEYSIEN